MENKLNKAIKLIKMTLKLKVKVTNINNYKEISKDF